MNDTIFIMLIFIIMAIYAWVFYSLGQGNSGLRYGTKRYNNAVNALKNLYEIELCEDLGEPESRCRNGVYLDAAIDNLKSVIDESRKILR